MSKAKANNITLKAKYNNQSHIPKAKAKYWILEPRTGPGN